MLRSSQPLQEGAKRVDAAHLPMSLYVSLVTVPVLGGLVLGTATLKLLKTLGELTEEAFRGDRLPLLTRPMEEQSVASQSTTAGF